MVQSGRTWPWQSLSSVSKVEYLQNFCIKALSLLGWSLLMDANWDCTESPVESLLFGKWAVCSGEQTLIFNKFIYRNFLKQLMELLFGLHSYLSLEVFRNKELCHVDIGGLQTYLRPVDTDGSHLPKPCPLRCFLPESLVTPTTLLFFQGKELGVIFTSPSSTAGSHPSLPYFAIAS